MSSGSVTHVTGTLFRMRTHILLDCPHEHLVSLRTQHRQLVFPPQYEDSPTRLRTFLNQPNIYGVAYFVAECLPLFPWFFMVWLQAFSKLPLKCPPEAYIAVGSGGLSGNKKKWWKDYTGKRPLVMAIDG
jgi:hypothetical protein